MVLADSVEPLHYPAIMFSSPLAPQPPPFPRPLPATNPTHSATTTLHHSSSSALSLSIPPLLTWLFLPVLLFIAVDSSPSSLHVFFYSLSLSLCPCICFSLHLSDPIPLKLLLFLCFMLSFLIVFTFICQFALIYKLCCHDFLTETILAKQNRLCESIKWYFMHSKPIKMINYSICIQGVWKIAHTYL